MSSAKSTEKLASEMDPLEYESQLASARKYVKANFIPDDGTISRVLNDSRKVSGHINHFAGMIDTGGAKNDPLLRIAYLAHLASQSHDTLTPEEKQNYTNALQNRIADMPEELRNQYLALTPFQHAVLEEKARLLSRRVYAIYKPKMTNKKFSGFLGDLHEALGDNDKAELDDKFMQFAATDHGVLEKKEIENFFGKYVREKIQAMPEDDEDQTKKKAKLNKDLDDVLELIEEERKARAKMGSKVEGERALREILCDDNVLVFKFGTCTLIRTGVNANKFIIMGGSREEWGSVGMMAMKYLQDRGDPWRGLVEISGSSEVTNYLRAVFRQNSIRMSETGHTEAFLASEIMYDVINNYRYNLARGYAVARTIEVNKNNEPIFIKEKADDGTVKAVMVEVTLGQLKDGTWKINVRPDDEPMMIEARDENGHIIYNKDGEPKQEPVRKKVLVPVPTTTEKCVFDREKLLETDTPPPESHIKNFDLRKRGIKPLNENSRAFVKSWQNGRESGSYCLCGSYTPKDNRTGRTPDETVYQSRLVRDDELNIDSSVAALGDLHAIDQIGESKRILASMGLSLNLEIISHAAELYETNQVSPKYADDIRAGRRPSEEALQEYNERNQGHLTRRLLASGMTGSNDNIKELARSGDLSGSPLNRIHTTEASQNEFVKGQQDPGKTQSGRMELMGMQEGLDKEASRRAASDPGWDI